MQPIKNSTVARLLKMILMPSYRVSDMRQRIFLVIHYIHSKSVW